MSFVDIDLGASDTRYVGNNKIIRILPNRIAFDTNNGPNGFTPVELEVDNPDKIESCLEFIVTKDESGVADAEKSTYFPMHFLMGSIAERSGLPFVSPVKDKHKTNQIVNYASMIACMTMTKILDNIDDDETTLGICLPYTHTTPDDIAKYKREITGKFEVFLPKYKGGTTISINVTKAGYATEGVVSILSFFMNTDSIDNRGEDPFVKENKKYSNPNYYTVSIDIGHSTTDFAVFKGSSLINSTVNTVNEGGISLVSAVTKALSKKEYGFSDSEIAEALSEGRIRIGASDRYIEFYDELKDAKEKLANSIYERMSKWFDEIGDIQAYKIGLVIVSGGGSLSSGYIDENGEFHETVPSIVDIMKDKIHDKFPGADIKRHSDDARMANIKGIFANSMIKLRSAN